MLGFRLSLASAIPLVAIPTIPIQVKEAGRQLPECWYMVVIRDGIPRPSKPIARPWRQN